MRLNEKDYALSNLNDRRLLIRVRCPYCKRAHVYYPWDRIQIFGNVDVDSLMNCEIAPNSDPMPTGINWLISLRK
jgi:hypothetical protein